MTEYRLHEAELPQNPYYLDETMLERFGIFCDLAEKYGLKLIVGLITGWMSGRTFIPPALFGRNLSSYTAALLFQQKFIGRLSNNDIDLPKAEDDAVCLATLSQNQWGRNVFLICAGKTGGS